jgi:ribosomal 50S subunit-recycling heat shock protein
MRIDKFLKVSRLAKRRSEAHEALVAGRITRDGRAVKPGYDVRAGDVLVLHYATKFLTVRVLDVPLRVTPAIRHAVLYEVLEERRDDPVDWLDAPALRDAPFDAPPQNP